jgi:hypothetical protein
MFRGTSLASTWPDGRRAALLSSRYEQHAIVAIVAAVWLILALLTGQALSPTPLKLYSVAGAAVTLLTLTYEHVVWRWPWTRKITGVPLLAGTWRGTITSSYIHPDGSAVASIPAAARITQSASRITVTVMTGESSSLSRHAQLTRLPDDRWSLSWFYDNTPRMTVRPGSDRHCGSADATLNRGDGHALVGGYFTDRLTRGEVRFEEWSRALYGSAEAALQAANFQTPQPFANRRL